MTRIIVDSVLRTKLDDFREPLELCDEAGKVLARVIPCPKDYVVPPLDEAELERRRQEGDFSTAEVLAYLEKL